MTRRFHRILRIAGAVVLLLVLLALAGAAYLSRDGEPYFNQRKGEVAEVILQGKLEEADQQTHLLRIVSTSGLSFELAVRRPTPIPEHPIPLILLVGGHRTGRDAVHLLPPTPGLAVAALSYPYDGNLKPKGLEVLKVLPKVRRTLMDMPPALSLALDHLLTDPNLDPQRTELVGVSLGAPIATATGGWDPRFTRIWSVHGGGDLPHMIDHNLKREVPNPILRKPLAFLGGLLVAPLEPERFVGRISPRELVMLNAMEDERIPRGSVEALYAAAEEPKQLLWLEGEHVHPRQEETMRELLGVVLGRLQVE